MKLDDEVFALIRRFNTLLQKTASAAFLPAPGFWVGDTAGERRVLDDWAAGRVAWRAAHLDAQHGLDALDQGDIATARMYAWTATDHYIAALEMNIAPGAIAGLGRAAKPRGRRPTPKLSTAKKSSR